MKLGEYIYNYRKARGLSQREFAKICGVSNTYITYIEIGRSPSGKPMIPTVTKLKAIAHGMGMTMQELIDAVDDFTVKLQDEIEEYGFSPLQRQAIPMLGEIACGKPTYAAETRESYVMSGTSIQADLCLTARGDSMINARIFDGDIVFIKKQEIVDNGEIAAVIIGDEATLKRVYYYPDEAKMILVAENPKYPPLVYVNEQLNEVTIIGKAIAFQSDIR